MGKLHVNVNARQRDLPLLSSLRAAPADAGRVPFHASLHPTQNAGGVRALTSAPTPAARPAASAPAKPALDARAPDARLQHCVAAAARRDSTPTRLQVSLDGTVRLDYQRRRHHGGLSAERNGGVMLSAGGDRIAYELADVAPITKVRAL
eukprot:4234455-Prymnesium_polylepis.1